MPKREKQFETEMNPLAVRLEQYLLALPGVWKDFAWGGCLYKTRKGKLVAALFGDETAVRILSKLTKEEQAAAVDHEKTLVASHIGRHGWITYILSGADDLEQAEGYVCRSFELVAPKTDLKLLSDGQP